MDASVTFFVSLLLLLAFIAFRFFEESRGRKLWPEARAKADVVVSEAYKSAVMGSVPTEYREAFAHFLNRMAHDAVIFLVEGLRAIERPLARLSFRLRQRPQGMKKDPSPFLKTLAPDKKPEGADTGDTV
jgi:hypothetical protein